jgi:hypothetical protein
MYYSAASIISSFFRVFGNSANQSKDSKILFSDWLQLFLQENLMGNETFPYYQGKP